MRTTYFKDWEQLNTSCFIRKSIHNYDLAHCFVTLSHNKWYYIIINSDRKRAFPAANNSQNYTYSKEQSQKIVDNAIEQIGYKLLNEKLKILLST